MSRRGIRAGIFNGGLSVAFGLMGLLFFLVFKNSFFIAFWLSLTLAPMAARAENKVLALIIYLAFSGIIWYFLFDVTFGGQINNFTYDMMGYRISFEDFRLGVVAGTGLGFFVVLLGRGGLKKLTYSRNFNNRYETLLNRIDPNRPEKGLKLMFDFGDDKAIFINLAEIVYILSLYFRTREQQWNQFVDLFNNTTGLKISELQDKEPLKDTKDLRHLRSEKDFYKNLLNAFKAIPKILEDIEKIQSKDKYRIARRMRIRNKLNKIPILKKLPTIQKYVNAYEDLSDNLKELINAEMKFVEHLKTAAEELIKEAKSIKEATEKGTTTDTTLLIKMLVMLFYIKYYLVLLFQEFPRLLQLQKYDEYVVGELKRRAPTAPLEELSKTPADIDKRLRKVNENYIKLWNYVVKLQKAIGELKPDELKKLSEYDVNKALLNRNISVKDLLNAVMKIKDEIENKSEEINKDVEEKIKKALENYKQLTPEKKSAIMEAVLKRIGNNEVNEEEFKNIVSEEIDALGAT